MKVFNVSFQVETNLSAEEVKTAILEVIARGDLELESGPHEFAESKASTVMVRDEDHQLADDDEIPEGMIRVSNPSGSWLARDFDDEGGE